MIGATPTLLQAQLAGNAVLQGVLGVVVPPEWPPEHLDETAIRWTLSSVEAQDSGAIWRLYYIALQGAEAMVIGTCGFKGPPDADDAVEVGYSLLAAWHARGYATEATQALIALAQRHRARHVIAETYPTLPASIRVMEKCGLHYAGAGSAAGTIRYRRDLLDMDATG